MVAVKTFVPTANQAHATIIGVTTGVTAMPSSMLPGISAYISSKIAQTKLIEFVAAENPNIFAASVHPGMVETATFTQSGAKAESLPMDNSTSLFLEAESYTDLILFLVKLPAHFMVWLASPQAAFLRGRSVWANWDVEELKAQAQDIQAGLKMTSGINGWPY